MKTLWVHHLRFTLQARTLVHFGGQAGAQIRGAFWEALRQFACNEPGWRHDPEHTRHCPMCRLMALELSENARGVTPPRPFAIQPPLLEKPGADTWFEGGQPFNFGIGLFGDAADLFPYAIKAVQGMGEVGAGYGRGQFTLQQVQAVNPLTGETQNLLHNERIISAPGLPIGAEQVEAAADKLDNHHLSLRFLTPTQITFDGGRMMTQPQFDAIIARLLERCQALETHYAEPESVELWRERFLHLTEAAKAIQVRRNETRWLRLESGSRRANERNTVGGLVGTAIFEGDLSAFKPWLVWGQLLHIGKNAVKGSGIVRIER